ncbi:MAG: hypothetical protein JWR10_4359, partial [Rubritepida sp.]|nr:hypothetical protein [Rubritepida sp.]
PAPPRAVLPSPPPAPVAPPRAAMAAPPVVVAALPVAVAAAPPTPAPVAPAPPLPQAAAPPPPAPPAQVAPAPLPQRAAPPPQFTAAPAPILAPPVHAAPPPAPASEPGIDWGALAAASRPAPPVFREAEVSQFAAPVVPEPEAETAPVSTAVPLVGFSLLDAIGLTKTAAPPPPAPGGTLARLRNVVALSSELPSPGSAYQPGPGMGVSQPAPFGPYGGDGVVPASAVTVPLGEVMRLVAAGGPPVASPVDTFRTALRSSSSF